MRNIVGLSAILLLTLTSCAPDTPKPAVEKPGGEVGFVSLTSANFEKEVLHSKQPVLVDIGAPG